MKKIMIGMMLLASGVFAAPRFAVGVRFGVPAPAAVVRPVCPGPGYVWNEGYYTPNRVWVGGYWGRGPVARVAPRYEHARIVEHPIARYRR